MDDKELRAMLGEEEPKDMDYEKEIKRLKIQVRGAWNMIDYMEDRNKLKYLEILHLHAKMNHHEILTDLLSARVCGLLWAVISIGIVVVISAWWSS